MKQPKTHQEKIEWYSVLHKQNLNGRETEDELFELGISAGIEETEELQDEFAIKFAYWCEWRNDRAFKTYEELLEIYKKENQL
jgi:hypothetical protein